MYSSVDKFIHKINNNPQEQNCENCQCLEMKTKSLGVTTIYEQDWLKFCSFHIAQVPA